MVDNNEGGSELVYPLSFDMRLSLVHSRTRLQYHHECISAAPLPGIPIRYQDYCLKLKCPNSRYCSELQIQRSIFHKYCGHRLSLTKADCSLDRLNLNRGYPGPGFLVFSEPFSNSSHKEANKLLHSKVAFARVDRIESASRRWDTRVLAAFVSTS